jgi:uncharacterized protein (TIGR03086 family)
MKPAELYSRTMEAAQRIVDGVPASSWKAPSPCSEWDVRDVVNHIIGENLWARELFQGKTIAEVGGALEGDLTVGDPPAEYARSVEAVKAVLAAPEILERTVHLSFGDRSGSFYATQLALDMLIHGWDIAKGTGQDARLDPELVRECLPIAEQITRDFRAGGWYGRELPVQPDAGPQARLLALFGRAASWEPPKRRGLRIDPRLMQAGRRGRS